MRFKMKNKLAPIFLLFAILLICRAPTVIAAPAAELSMRIADWQQVGDAIEFDLEINIGMPSEPYASLDFNIVSSNEASLHIIDLSASGDRSELAIDFTSEYSGVYHKGRINEADGSVSYLVGLFSQNSGNNITDETSVGLVKLRYTGDSPEELTLSDYKLVFKDANGEITAAHAPSSTAMSMEISPDSFVAGTTQERSPDASVSSVDLPEADIPMSDVEPSNGEFPFVVICVLVAAALLIFMIIVFYIMTKAVKRSNH